MHTLPYAVPSTIVNSQLHPNRWQLKKILFIKNLRILILQYYCTYNTAHCKVVCCVLASQAIGDLRVGTEYEYRTVKVRSYFIL